MGAWERRCTCVQHTQDPSFISVGVGGDALYIVHMSYYGYGWLVGSMMSVDGGGG